MSSIRQIRPVAIVMTVLGLLAGGCVINGSLQREMRVSPASARVLKKLNAGLAAAGAEVSFDCSTSRWTGATYCTVRIDGAAGAGIRAEMIDHPFEARPMVYRITGGSQQFQGGLYQTLGEFAQTTEYQDDRYERNIELEDKKLRFRCTATRVEPAQYQCWTLIAAALLD